MPDTGWKDPANADSTTWFNPGNVTVSDNAYTASNTVGNILRADTFNFFASGPAAGKYRIITLIELRVEAKVAALGGRPSISLSADLSWRGGGQWTSPDPVLNWISGLDTYKTFILLSDIGNQKTWGRKWLDSNMTNGNFRVRLTVVFVSGLGVSINVDNLQVKVHYEDIRHVGAGGGIIMSEDKIVLMG